MRMRTLIPAILMLPLMWPQMAAAQFAPGSRELFSLDLGATPVGEFPEELKLIQGAVEMVMKDGVPMLKSSSRTMFLINLSERLPEQFTLEFDLVPKTCCQPEDLGFEGTPTINQGEQSMNFMWRSADLRAVGGGTQMDIKMPEEVAVLLPGQLTEIRVTVDGGTFQVYTNDELVVNWTDRKFVRGRVLRVFLGGQDESERAVYLSKLRVATDLPAPGQE
jgi:hypothetical protein